ncbi:MAG: glycosyltransferase [Anditalea sp.]
MKVVMYYHSLISGWNHGNAHFLRGIYASLQRMEHEVIVYEPKGGWSLSSLLQDYGNQALENFNYNFPHLQTNFYDPKDYNLQEMLEGADLVIVHEWNDPELVRTIGQYRLVKDFTLFFHDTHHRAISAKEEMENFELIHYDGVLAFGNTLRNVYKQEGWHEQVWTWHEAADLDTYYPMDRGELIGDVVWVGNWGDEERTQEIHEYIIEPIKALHLKAKFYGVRYPQHAIDSLEKAGIAYGGYLPTSSVAEIYSKYKATIHVPRRFYREHLHGIPTIRPFEAMSCKIPLLSAPWKDTEHLFTKGKDYLMAENGEEMTKLLDRVLSEEDFARSMTDQAYDTICSRHTCDHRAKELLEIYAENISQKVKRGGLK